MRTRAAVAFEAGKPLEITEVELEEPFDYIMAHGHY